MKVREVMSSPSNVSGAATKDDKRAVDTRETNFQSRLRRIENYNYEERLRELADEIIRQGEKLGKKADISELKVYKRLISGFLDEAVGRSYKFSKQNLLDRRGRHRVYAVIKKVNEELELLTRDILSAEKDNIKILQRLDDIRGLILDIIM